MSLDPTTCLECAGTGYVDGPADISRTIHDPKRITPTKCLDCNGTGTEPTPDPLNWNPTTDPVVRAILAMGEGER